VFGQWRSINMAIGGARTRAANFVLQMTSYLGLSLAS